MLSTVSRKSITVYFHCNDHIATEWNIPGESAELFVNPVKFIIIPDMTWKIPELPKVPLCFGSAESVCVRH